MIAAQGIQKLDINETNETSSEVEMLKKMNVIEHSLYNQLTAWHEREDVETR